MALADKAVSSAPSSGSFKKPNITQFIPPGMADVVSRTVAAAMKLMYSPQMRDTLMQQVKAQGTVQQKLADNTTGLMLTLDQKVKGGIPVAAIFPAAVGVASECAEVLVKAGQPVSQEDFNDSMLMIYVQIGKKLGGGDDQLMHGAQQALGMQPQGGGDAAELPPGAAQAAQTAGGGPPPGAAPGGPPGMPPGAGAPPGMPPGAPAGAMPPGMPPRRM